VRVLRAKTYRRKADVKSQNEFLIHANRACIEDLCFARADIIGKLFWEASWSYMPETQEWIRKAETLALFFFEAPMPKPKPLRVVLETHDCWVIVPVEDSKAALVEVFNLLSSPDYASSVEN
jgi:hypothetical protein